MTCKPSCASSFLSELRSLDLSQGSAMAADAFEGGACAGIEKLKVDTVLDAVTDFSRDGTWAGLRVGELTEVQRGVMADWLREAA